jgi:hypothetical protein
MLKKEGKELSFISNFYRLLFGTTKKNINFDYISFAAFLRKGSKLLYSALMYTTCQFLFIWIVLDKHATFKRLTS